MDVLNHVKPIGLALLVVLVSACSEAPPSPPAPAALTVEPWAVDEVARVHAPNFAAGGRQQDVYLIEIKTAGADTPMRLVIDAGQHTDMASAGLAYWRRWGVQHVDVLYVTHPHKDHYGGVQALLEEGMSIGRLVMNQPKASSCAREVPWGCDAAHIEQTIAKAKAQGVQHEELRVNDPKRPVTLLKQDGVELTLWFAPDGTHPVLGDVDINDMSLFMRLDVDGFVYWFTGDMNSAAGDYLVKQLGGQLKADVLKVPHHGAESTVGNAFFTAVSPQFTLVPAHTGLWCSERSQRIREDLALLGAQTYVMGLQGDVLVRHFKGRPPVWASQHPASLDCASSVGTPSAWAGGVAWAEFQFHVDSLAMTQWAGKPVLRARGWQFPKQKKLRWPEAGLALVGEQGARVWLVNTPLRVRDDVQQAFAQEGLGTEPTGFSQLVSLAGVPPGRYELALVRWQGKDMLGAKTGRVITVGTAGQITLK